MTQDEVVRELLQLMGSIEVDVCKILTTTEFQPRNEYQKLLQSYGLQHATWVYDECSIHRQQSRNSIYMLLLRLCIIVQKYFMCVEAHS